MAKAENNHNFSGASDMTTLSEGMARALNFMDSSRLSTPQATTLRGSLSLRSTISTTSSFTNRLERATKSADERGEYGIIGRGSGGTVFEIPGTEHAIKKGSNTQTMWNDFLLTNKVHNSFAETRDLLQEKFPQYVIPRTASCIDFWLPDCISYWSTNLQRYPASHRDAGAAFLVDRILPLPQPQRDILIDKYFDEDEKVREEARHDENNQCCLVRIYLGENESEEQSDLAYDSLQNFEMRLNMVRDCLGDAALLAAEIAIALAVIHWQAQIDAMDCEFVLGSSIATPPDHRKPFTLDSNTNQLPKPRNLTLRTFNRREIHLWALDFDKASPIKLTPQEVDDKLVPAFMSNDPYYPRPDVDEGLWEHFSTVYLKASHVILSNRKLGNSTIMGLPRRFLRKVEARIEENEGNDLEVTFGN